MPARDVLARVASRPQSRSSCLIAMRSHHRIPRPPATVDPDLSGSVKTRAGLRDSSPATFDRHGRASRRLELAKGQYSNPPEFSGMIMGCRRTVRLEQAGQSVIWRHPFRSTLAAADRHGSQRISVASFCTVLPMVKESGGGACGCYLAGPARAPLRPPGHAKQGARRTTFQSALEQCEQFALDVRERDLAWLDSVWPITPNPRDCSTGWNARSRWQVLCREVPGGTLAQTGEQRTLYPLVGVRVSGGEPVLNWCYDR